MKKTLFLIPGFPHVLTSPDYTWLIKEARAFGYDVHSIQIDWHRKTFDQYEPQFIEAFSKRKGEYNIVLGFSFGAMLAALTAPITKPDELVLCSLSCYFAEDLPTILKSWRNVIGTRRIEAFKHRPFAPLAKQIECKTQLILGEGELRWPQMEHRSRDAHARIASASLQFAQEAGHDIGHPGYKTAIRQALGMIK